MKKPVTNEQLLLSMVRLSKAGGIKQAFVLEAIRIYSEQVITLTEDEWGKNSFISLDIWKQCASECVQAINDRG
ncbi:MAG: hypothetical protein EBZ61_06635 [Micrococcales bacterium]|nr:hypothetical protein [Micrococcales bacterium]